MLRLGAGLGQHPVVGLFLVYHTGLAAMASDATWLGMYVVQKLLVNQHLFPCLQRRQLASSAFAGGKLGDYLLRLLGQLLQHCLVGVASNTVVG